MDKKQKSTDRKRPLSEKELQEAVDILSDIDSISDAATDDDSDSIDQIQVTSESDHSFLASDESDTLDGEYDAETNEQIFSTTYVGKDNTVWSANCQPASKTKSHNIIKGKVSKIVLPPGYVLEDPLEAFTLYLDESIITDIVKYTNLEAERLINAIGMKKHNRNTLWKKCDEIELNAYIGLLITAGHLKQNMTNINVLWNPIYGPPIFRATMGSKRFKMLTKFIRFDDKATRSVRRETDKFAPFRDIWNKINHNLGKHYIPGENLTIDEQLVPFRGRCPFRQYMPAKPDRYGMKIWWICDSKTYYPLQGIPYLGKEGNARSIGLASQVVETLATPYHGTNRNITFDNYFTSLNLANQLLSVGLTMVGTVKKNKTFIPQQFLPNNRREIHSSLFGFSKKCTIVSYVPKRNKAVVLLSTMHSTREVVKEKENKPEVILYYNKTKGGVDSLDQLVHEYMSKRKSNRYFLNMVDCCGIAAYVVWITLYPKWNIKKNYKRRLFLTTLAEELVRPAIERRRVTKNIQKNIKNSMSQFIAPSYIEKEDKTEVVVQKKRRCFLCPSKLSRMQKQLCNKCNKSVCNEHSKVRRCCHKCAT